MRADAVIKNEGIKILKEGLGVVEMEHFISLINREKFNYTKWRQELFDDMSIEEISGAAETFAKEKFGE